MRKQAWYYQCVLFLYLFTEEQVDGIALFYAVRIRQVQKGVGAVLNYLEKSSAFVGGFTDGVGIVLYFG